MLSRKQATSLPGSASRGKKMGETKRVKYYGLRIWSRKFYMWTEADKLLNKRPVISFSGAPARHGSIGFRIAR